MEHEALLISCGALAKELAIIQKNNDWQFMKIHCLPAELHNQPHEIPRAVEEAILINKDKFQNLFVAYGDCGTGGQLDKIIKKYNVERIPGVHCYDFFCKKNVFEKIQNDEPGTFYLTDFLVKNFDQLVIKGLGLDQHPELKEIYFNNYQRIVYLVQKDTEKLKKMAMEHAKYLELNLVIYKTGLDPLERTLKEQIIQWQN